MRSTLKVFGDNVKIDEKLMKIILSAVEEYKVTFSWESYLFVSVFEGKYDLKAGGKRLENLANELTAYDVIGSLVYETKQKQISGLLALPSETYTVLKTINPNMKFVVAQENEQELIKKFWVNYMREINPSYFNFILLQG